MEDGSVKLNWVEMEDGRWEMEAKENHFASGGSQTSHFHCFLTILDQEHELQGMDGRRFEAKALIKIARPIVLGLDKNRADTGDFGGLKRSQNGISKQTPTDLFPLMTNIHGQSGQDHHRNGMPSQSLPDSCGRGGVIQRPHRQAVIADNPAFLIMANDKGPNGIGPLILKGIASQPIVEQDLTAIETGAIMFFRKQHRSRIGHCIRYHFGHPTFPRSPVLR